MTLQLCLIGEDGAKPEPHEPVDDVESAQDPERFRPPLPPLGIGDVHDEAERIEGQMDELVDADHGERIVSALVVGNCDHVRVYLEVVTGSSG